MDTKKIISLQNHETMIEVNDYLFLDRRVNLEIGIDSKVGVFARNEEVVYEFLLALSGMIRTDSIKHHGKRCYDQANYFSKRIFADGALTYFSTLNAGMIARSIEAQFHKVVDEEQLTKRIKDLYMRRECLISDQVEFTPMGNTMMLLSVLLATSCNLIIHHPLIHLNEAMKEYFVQELTSRHQALVVGVEHLADWKSKLDAILVFGDLNHVFLVDPKIDEFYAIDATLAYEDRKVFVETSTNQHVVIGWDKNIKQYCDRQHLKYKKIDFYEIEKILPAV